MPKYSRTFLAAVAAACAVALAPDAYGASAADDKAIYDRIVSLAGDWTGHMEDPLAGPPVTVRYEVASGGKAVIEHQSPAGSLPTVTVYFLASGKLRAAQYSPAGNQPAYKLGGESTAELVQLRVRRRQRASTRTTTATCTRASCVSCRRSASSTAGSITSGRRNRA